MQGVTSYAPVRAFGNRNRPAAYLNRRLRKRGSKLLYTCSMSGKCEVRSPSRDTAGRLVRRRKSSLLLILGSFHEVNVRISKGNQLCSRRKGVGGGRHSVIQPENTCSSPKSCMQIMSLEAGVAVQQGRFFCTSGMLLHRRRATLLKRRCGSVRQHHVLRRKSFAGASIHCIPSRKEVFEAPLTARGTQRSVRLLHHAEIFTDESSSYQASFRKQASDASKKPTIHLSSSSLLHP